MGEISIIDLNLAKQVFQVHGADKAGRYLFAQAAQAACHETRLVPPAYVKPYVKRSRPTGWMQCLLLQHRRG